MYKRQQYAPDTINDLLQQILNAREVWQARSAWRRLQPYTVQVLRRDIQTFRLHIVSELVQKADRFGTEPPEVYEWPTNMSYSSTFGLDTGSMDALVY